MKIRKMAAALCSILMFAGCAGPRVDGYQNDKPVLDLKQYFDGDVLGWGMFQNRSGKVVKRFHVNIKGSWKGDVGTLEENFTYSDGTESRRVWTVTRIDANNYTGTAADVIGEATGVASGNAVRWRYVLALEVDGKTYQVNFDDWMYLVDENTLMNRSEMKKFGFRLGEVILAFRKKT